MKEFLNEDQEKAVIRAIREAETSSSGEIRVHLEAKCDKDDPIERAKEVFAELNMHETELRNGTIIYVASEDHKIAIWEMKESIRKLDRISGMTSLNSLPNISWLMIMKQV